jgi:hypothetical protein
MNRRNESDYMDALRHAIPVEKWCAAVGAAGARADDASARAWLADSLVGKPNVTGQQLSRWLWTLRLVTTPLPSRGSSCCNPLYASTLSRLRVLSYKAWLMFSTPALRSPMIWDR